MAVGNPNIAEAGKKTRFKPGVVTNPKGPPKGTKHINTYIQELLTDENFTATVREGLAIKEYKGAPIKAIIQAQVRLAMAGDSKAFENLAKYGWSMKQEIDTKIQIVQPILSEIAPPPQNDVIDLT